VNELIVVGFDASPESRAAGDWAAREALRRGWRLEVLHVREPGVPDGDEEARRRGAHLLTQEGASLRTLAPGTRIEATQLPGPPAAVLEAAGEHAGMLVLGSRHLGRLRGFLTGSVSREVLGRAACPVVLVRAAAGAEGGRTADDSPYREVVLGLDVRFPYDEVLDFAFRAAAARGALLRAVHAWAPPTGPEYAALTAIGVLDGQSATAEEQAMEAVLAPWRDRYPQVRLAVTLQGGHAGPVLLAAADRAGLVVVGRRARRAAFGVRLGSVAHTVVHHAACAVAVVPYDTGE
jgi:nucleotide-binding universal stress UspA family protein